MVVTQLGYDHVLALLGCILQGVYGSTQLIKVLVGTLQAIEFAPSFACSAQTSASRIFEALDVNCTYNICVLTYLQIQDIHCQGLVTKKLNCRGGSKAGAFLKNFTYLLQGFSFDLDHMVCCPKPRPWLLENTRLIYIYICIHIFVNMYTSKSF